MAEPELSTFFPVPPPFYKAFTKANQDQLQQLRDSVSEPSPLIEQVTNRVLDLPPEVRLLIPPKPPSDGIHQSFGAELGGPEKTLTELGAEQLIPSPPSQPPTTTNSTTNPTAPLTTIPWTQTRATHLKSLTQSIMLNFLELLGTLSINPQHAHDKVTDLEILFLNAHNLVNELRPHQARDELIWTLRKRLEGIEREIEGVRLMRRRTEELLDGFRRDVGNGDTGEGETGMEDGIRSDYEEGQRRDQAAAWMALDREVSMG